MPPPTLGTFSTRWPRERSASATSAVMPGSSSSSKPCVQTRGASIASCRLMPWSIRLTIAWKAEGKMRKPPGRPSAKASLPSFTAIIGDIEVKTRLPGAIDSAKPGCGSKLNM